MAGPSIGFSFLCSEFQVLGFEVCGFELLAFGGSRLMHGEVFRGLICLCVEGSGFGCDLGISGLGFRV